MHETSGNLFQTESQTYLLFICNMISIDVNQDDENNNQRSKNFASEA